ncbi:MAG TPA: EI24 domain-containing protein [Saprospiraceae bacterium]|nr:EI24 domain-containing protein [Saprospiraceae bacterium]
MFRQISNIIALFFGTITGKKSDALKYIFYSGLAALLICAGLIYLGFKFASVTGEYLGSLVPWEWAHESIVFSIIIGIAVFLLFFMLIKYILLIALSPMLSYISERTELVLQGSNKGAGFSFAKSTVRSVRINMRNMLKELSLTVILLILGFFPLLTAFVVPVMFLVQAYFTGFGIMDFYLERHFTFKESVTKVYQHKWAAIALGSIFLVMFAIPILGIVLAPYFTTVAGTRYFIEKTESKTPIQGVNL